MAALNFRNTFAGTIVMIVILTQVLSRQTDVRWLLQPELQIKVIEHENMTFHWLYKPPPQTRNSGTLMFAHHIPGNSAETVLLQGSVTPSNGALQINFNLYPERIFVSGTGHEIRIDVTDVALNEFGRYLLDLSFDSDAAMHDLIDVVTFKDPKWEAIPRTEILARSTSHVTLKWKRNMTEGQPEVEAVTLLYSPFESDAVVELINSYKPAKVSHWQTEFSPEGMFLSDRMLHEYNPDRDVFQISIWDLDVSDSGEYELRLIFEDGVTELTSSIDLHVTESSKWLAHPGDDVYGVLFNDVNLTYLPSTNSTAQAQKYKLYKFQDRHEEELITISVTGNDLVERRSRSVNFSKDILCAFNNINDGQGLKLTFHDIKPEYNGSYLLKMFLEETLAVKHNFHFHVLTEPELWPTVSVNDQMLELQSTSLITTDAGMYTFIMPSALPRPHVVMFAGSDTDPVVHADVNGAEKFDLFLEGYTLVDGLNVVVDYKFYSLRFQIGTKGHKLVSHAGVFTAFNEYKKESAIVYLTCFCLLMFNVIIIIVTFCTYRQLHAKTIDVTHRCQCRCQCDSIKHNHVNENIYEIPRKESKLSLDTNDGLTTSTPLSNSARYRKSWCNSPRAPDDSQLNGDADWLSGDENEPMISEQMSPMVASPLASYPDSILKINSSSTPKRVTWEEQLPISYEQMEQGSPKLPRY